MDKYDVMHITIMGIFIGLCIEYGLSFWQIVSLVALIFCLTGVIIFEVMRTKIDEEKIEAVLKKFGKL